MNEYTLEGNICLIKPRQLFLTQIISRKIAFCLCIMDPFPPPPHRPGSSTFTPDSLSFFASLSSCPNPIHPSGPAEIKTTSGIKNISSTFCVLLGLWPNTFIKHLSRIMLLPET